MVLRFDRIGLSIAQMNPTRAVSYPRRCLMKSAGPKVAGYPLVMDRPWVRIPTERSHATPQQGHTPELLGKRHGHDTAPRTDIQHVVRKRRTCPPPPSELVPYPQGPPPRLESCRA